MNRRVCHAVATLAAAVVASSMVSISPAQAADDVVINLVAVNDFHGQIDDRLVQWAATVEQLLAEGSTSNSLLLSAGDNVGESAAASKAQNDNPTIDVLNLLGLDASAVGNHEFDKGYDDLVGRIIERADFPILGANVKKVDGSAALDVSSLYDLSGVRIAVIGAVTQTTPELLDPSGVEGLIFGDPVTAINAEVDRLATLPAAEQPDVIVAMIHEGAPWGTWTLEQAMQASSVFASIVEDTSPEVDALIMGHSHNTYVYDLPVPGDPSRTRPIIQTGFHGKSVGQIQLTVDSASGDVKAYSARNVARVTTSDDDLIATSPTLATIAEMRDAAVAFAASQAEAKTMTQQEFDEAIVARDEAYAAASTAKDEYETAIAARNEAYATAAGLKQEYLAGIAQADEAYAAAAAIRDEYLVAAAAGKDAYSVADGLKQEYYAATSQGNEAYATAAGILPAYHAARAAGAEAYATAAAIVPAYQAARAAGAEAYATAAAIVPAYKAARASGAEAYATAERTRLEYLELMAVGDPDSSEALALLAQEYQVAIAAGDEAYATAAGMIPPHQAATAAGAEAYATAAGMIPPHQAATAAGAEAYARAEALIPSYQAAMSAFKDAHAHAASIKVDYDTAIANGKAAYASAAGMVPAYQAAMSVGDEAYAAATALTPAYQAAMAAGEEAHATAVLLKPIYDAAIETWQTAIATVSDLQQTLLSFL